MHATALVTLNMRELDRLKVVQAVVEIGLKPGRAAERLGLTVRQVERLVRRYEELGAAGLASRKRVRRGNRRLDEGVACRALAIIRERYADFGPTLACEKLWECHGIHLAKETVRKLMTDAGLWIPRRQRPPKIYQPRARRACFGELIQIDGSDHAWFEQRAPECTLLVYVDDATSRLMMLHFTATESTFSYFEATRAYLERYGKPVAFYSDKASVFRPTTKGEAGVTHFGRAMYELNIDTFCANSSPAKGRVERAHDTLQDRLVKELRLRNISTIAEANGYAPSFMAAYNARFAKPAKSEFDAHRPLRADEDLDVLLTWRAPRKVSKALTVQYDRVLYLLEDTLPNRKLIGRYLEVWEYPDGRIELRADGQVLPYREYDKLAEVEAGAIVEHKHLGHARFLAEAGKTMPMAMAIAKEELERLKSEVSLKRLIESQGHDLMRRGKDWVMRCPFHDDVSPSLVVTESKNLYHCFGCGAAGSVLDWVMKTQGVSLPHVVQLLKQDAPLAGVWNASALVAHKEIIVCEALIDATTF